MNNLSKTDLDNIAKLLRLASNEFSNHGCNDFEISNNPANQEMMKDFELKTYGEIEFEADNLEVINVHDAYLMGYYADKLEAITGLNK